VVDFSISNVDHFDSVTNILVSLVTSLKRVNGRHGVFFLLFCQNRYL
jgi:hypothetical protein